MDKEEIKKIMNYIADNYKDNFKITQDMKKYWIEQLSQYDYNDVDTRLKQLMGEERYAYQPPLLEAITRGLTKKNKKVDFSKLTFYCRICKKAFNELQEMQTHEDRCSSIRYIKSQYKRFNWGELNNEQIANMYNMSEEAFDTKYKILLRKVQKLTTSEMEKQTIEFIFNPPNQEQVKAYFQNI